MPSTPGTTDISKHVAAALECHRRCEETISYCLDKGGQHAEAALIRALTDCADMCRMCADFMVRRSEFSVRLCGICADVCDRCADLCAMFSNDPQMARCATACRQCASLCQEMAGATH
ncbi:four-helix bundle copper-binding protein [Longispora albida]|uniref:four-helix bundle copper-binding protein n=1 Tax=Longispora albida TaxID=203523 RepID=UPI00039E2398|nr:four-helix bundle copper-binding protein [Longispora albida]